MKQHKFLIILAYYERPKIVLNALESILEIDYDNFEVHFIDDGSVQKGEPIVREKCASIIDKFTFHYIDNTPQQKDKQGGSIHGKYLNIAIQESDADYVMILCDDDAIHPNFFKKFNDFINQEGDNRKAYYYNHTIIYDCLTENWKTGLERGNKNHFTNRHTQPISPSFNVDSSQIIYSRRKFLSDGLSYPFPQTKNLDAAIYSQMVHHWGLCHFTGLDCQIKSHNGLNLGNRHGGNIWSTKDKA